MKKYLLALLLLLVFPVQALAQFNPFVGSEHIKKFDATIQINQDGTIHVTEDIQYDFASLERHGIYREIPYVKTNKDGKKYEMTLHDFSVTDEQNNAWQYTTSKEGELYRLKIGDPDKTIMGLHTYKIEYTADGALTYFSDHDELYWNVTGNDWDVPIASATAKIILPKKTEAKINATCYSGSLGSTDNFCSSQTKDSTYSFATGSYLSVSDGFTVVAGFPKDMVAVLEPKEYGKLHPGLIALIVIGVLVWYVLLPVWIAIQWYKKGRDPKVTGPVSAWYDPPKTETGRKLTPAETGALLDETVDMKDVQSTIIDLARRGYLIIVEKTSNDFYFKKTYQDGYKPLHTKEKQVVSLTDFEKEMLEGIFKSGKEEVHLKTLKLYTTVDEVKKMIYQGLTTDNMFVGNPEKTRNIYIVLGVLSLTLGFNLPLFISCMIFGRNMPRKTVWGAEQRSIAQSLRNFLSSQDRQLEHQAKNQLFFEKLLPYAIALGVEKVWAKRFEDIVKSPPDWYQGSYNRGYSTNAFLHSMHSSFNQVSSAATPPSSSTGHSSGFSGGSSGGGGGGGGGGSW